MTNSSISKYDEENTYMKIQIDKTIYDLSKKSNVLAAQGHTKSKLQTLEVELSLAYQALDGEKIQEIQQKIDTGKALYKRLEGCYNQSK